MNNDRFSDTTELPIPQESDYPDPFATPPRRPSYSDGSGQGGAPRRTERNGAQSGYDSARRQVPSGSQSGYGEPRRSEQSSGQSGYGAPRRASYPNGQSSNGAAPRRRLNGAADARQNGYSSGESSPQRSPQQVPRQRTNQAGSPQRPHAPIRRASYQSQMPEEDQILHYQQPQQPYYPPEYDDEIREPAPKKKKRRKRRRHSCLRKIITSLLSLVIVLFALYSGAALLAIKRLEYEETGTRAIAATAAEPDADVRNVLLIGTDNREDERGRADTVILLSFSKHNHTVTMTSLMRDSYVNIPNHGTDKLNAAYAYGGATLLMDTITSNFGIPVDDYICVNFRAFVHIADALGGLKVEISDREAEAINVILQSEVNQIMGDDPMDDFLPSGGTFLLNGKQALAYARIRYVGNADFERTERQRKVLDLMLSKLKHPSPTAIPKILSKAVPELKTNMTTGQLYLLSLEVPVKLIGYDMQKLRLPADGTYSDQTAPDGQMVLAVDFDANLQLYLKTIHDAPAPEPTASEEAIS